MKKAAQKNLQASNDVIREPTARSVGSVWGGAIPQSNRACCGVVALYACVLGSSGCDGRDAAPALSAVEIDVTLSVPTSPFGALVNKWAHRFDGRFNRGAQTVRSKRSMIAEGPDGKIYLAEEAGPNDAGWIGIPVDGAPLEQKTPDIATAAAIGVFNGDIFVQGPALDQQSTRLIRYSPPLPLMAMRCMW